jgi:DNA polymerase-3 subunit epsilon
VSLGAFRVVEGRIRLGDMFAELINPEREISPTSIKIHGIVPDMVAEARSAPEVFDDFMVFLGGDILVAHHARFDLHFMNEVIQRRHGFPLQNLVIDTVVLCKGLKFLPPPYPMSIRFEDELYSLDSLAEHFDIEIYQRHSALGDALAVAMIFQRMLTLLERKGAGQLHNLIRIAGVAPRFHIGGRSWWLQYRHLLQHITNPRYWNRSIP